MDDELNFEWNEEGANVFLFRIVMKSMFNSNHDANVMWANTKLTYKSGITHACSAKNKNATRDLIATLW